MNDILDNSMALGYFMVLVSFPLLQLLQAYFRVNDVPSRFYGLCMSLLIWNLGFIVLFTFILMSLWGNISQGEQTG